MTVEGRDIRAEKLIRSEGATALFEYSVSADDEPGFFVSAQFVRKGQMYQGQKRVKVPPDEHKLNVKLVTDKPQYSPGQTATYDVDVTSADGRPVAQADLSLGVVDEAIYAIRPDETPDIVNFFYGREWDSVFTENSLTFFFNGEAGTRRMRLAELRHPSQLRAAQARAAGAAESAKGVSGYRLLGCRSHDRCRWSCASASARFRTL